MNVLESIIISVAANILAHYVIKWLDRDIQNTIISLKKTGAVTPVFLICHGIFDSMFNIILHLLILISICFRYIFLKF